MINDFGNNLNIKEMIHIGIDTGTRIVFAISDREIKVFNKQLNK